MLDKPEVLVEVTEQPRFLPWEFDTEMFLLRFSSSNPILIFTNKNKLISNILSKVDVVQ